ncbi:MAG: hypothetical protein HYR90_03035 [Candidatus Andersenbacteria bacterium]|nr:hypothetical protein [Candidatus Andersenbacteria bacterium]MBI3250237.1 hypothetical protein [Candidatus Andersenbacteria bacterium]
MNKKIVILLAILLVGLIFSGGKRPFRTVSLVQTPDDKHIHQVFAGNPLTQRIVAPTNSLHGFRFWLASTEIPASETEVIFTVKEVESNETIRSLSGPAAQFYDQTHIQYVDAQQQLDSYVPTLFFLFEPITGTSGKTYDFTLETLSVSKADAIHIRYESDASKYLEGKTFSQREEKQGNIGFVLYERPPIAILLVRWLTDTQHHHLLAALALIVIGGLALKLYGFPEPIPDALEGLTTLSHRAFALWAGGLIVATLCIYWPATHLFYFHDDLALLARAEQYKGADSWKLFLAHDYLEADEYSQFDLHFWRPVSAGLFSSIIWHSVGPKAEAAYFLNILLIAITAVGLFVLALIILRSPIAAAATAATWIAHSSKIGTAYWWSSNHDILAGLFAIASLLCFIWWRSKAQGRYLCASLVLYALAFLSKEHVLILPVIAFAIDVLTLKTLKKSAAVAAAPYVVVACLLLFLRAAVFSDPTLPPVTATNDTYTTRLTPSMLGQNLLTYADWTAENWLWPINVPGISVVEKPLSTLFNQSRLQSPYYPGIVLLLLYAGLLMWLRKDEKVFHGILLAGVWWLAFLGPVLFLANDWRFRWIYLSVFGLALLVGFLVLRVPALYRTRVGGTLLLVLVIYGTWQARVPERTRFYREQAEYIQEAARQYKQQQQPVDPHARILLIGVHPDQTTSLSAYLFRLLGSTSPVSIERYDSIPDSVAANDIIIDMTGKTAFYPGYEQ